MKKIIFIAFIILIFSCSQNLRAQSYENFSIEMAVGDIINEPTLEKLDELLGTLNDENFFLILSSEVGFMQTAYSEKGFTVEYKVGEKMYESETLFTAESLSEIFKLYITDSPEWKEKVKWVIME